MRHLGHLVLNMLALFITAYLVPGFEVTNIWSGLVAVVVLSIINIFILPVMLVVTLPINILTLGLFTFVVNGLMLLLASAIVPGFIISGIWPAIIGGIVLALVSAVIFGMGGNHKSR